MLLLNKAGINRNLITAMMLQSTTECKNLILLSKLHLDETQCISLCLSKRKLAFDALDHKICCTWRCQSKVNQWPTKYFVTESDPILFTWSSVKILVMCGIEFQMWISCVYHTRALPPFEFLNRLRAVLCGCCPCSLREQLSPIYPVLYTHFGHMV